MGSTSDKIKGNANEAIGKAKQGIGEATGSERLQGEGAVQEVKGKGQKAMGDAKDGAKDPRLGHVKESTWMPGTSPGTTTWRRQLFHRKQFHVEHQRRVRRDHAAGTARAVAELRRDDQRALAADLHRGDALVPAGDDTALADGEFERLVAIDGAIELLSLLAILVEPAGIVHHADLAGLRRSAGADDMVDGLQA